MTQSAPEPRLGPLAGIRVVDLSTTFMGPYCTMQMARMGADVIKVEEPGGDVTRTINDPTGQGLGPVFLVANHGKRSVTLDLKDPSGHAALLKLVQTADVVVHNMRPQAAQRLRISGSDIHRANPRCIYAALTGFGADGRYADLAAYDDVIQAVSGLATVQGGDGEPTYVKAAVADKIVGLMALGAISAALVERERTGRGTVVTVPMMESMVSFNLLEQQGGWVYDPPQGSTGYSRLSSPYRRPYRTADGYLGVVVYTDRMWAAFFQLIGRPELAEEERFANIAGRTAHIDELYALVENELAKRPSAFWETALAAHGIAVVPVNSVEDLFTDPHLSDVGFFEQYEHPTAGPLVMPRHPIGFGDRETAQELPAPLLGEHSREVLLGIGMAEAAVDALFTNGVTTTPPDKEITSQ